MLPNVGQVNDDLEAAFAGNLMDLTETTKAAFNSFSSADSSREGLLSNSLPLVFAPDRSCEAELLCFHFEMAWDWHLTSVPDRELALENSISLILLQRRKAKANES